MKACVILPTYNEAENIEKIIRKVKRHKVDILVVDDNSPDGTAKLAEGMNVNLLKRDKKEGLGKAYIAGFKHAMNEYDILFEMDADLSHQPKYIHDFLKEIEENDLVIGSRYVKNGKIENWNLYRKTVSFVGNLFGKYVAGLKVKDCTSGYRAIRTELLKKIDLDNLIGGGYSFQISLLKQCQRKNARIKEIPIVFVDRKKGKSKLGKKEMTEFIKTCLMLRFKKY